MREQLLATPDTMRIINSYRFAGVPSYDLIETFEADEFDNSGVWTKGSGATGNYGDGGGETAIVGSRSLSVTTGWSPTTLDVGGMDDCYVYFMMKLPATVIAFETPFYFRDASSSNILRLNTLSATQFRILDGDGGANNISGTVSGGDELHWWVEFERGASDAVCRAGWSLSGTKPTLLEVTGLTIDVAVDHLRFNAINSTATLFDNLIVHSSPIGSNPL